MIRTTLVLLSLLASTVDTVAMAHQEAVPLLLPEDIQAASAPHVFQGVTGSSAGAIYFPDQVLAVRVGSGDTQNEVMRQWSKSYGFLLVPLTVSVEAASGFIPEQVDVIAAFPAAGRLTQQPIIIDTFPKTGFKPAKFNGEGEVKINAGLQIEPLPASTMLANAAPSVGVEGTAVLKFKYTPAYADVVSGFGSGEAFWQFSRTQEHYPIGAIPIKLLIAVPARLTASALGLSFEVRVQFAGSWWTKGRAIANYVTTVDLPEKE